MSLPYRTETPLGELEISAAAPGDLPEILTLFDEAVLWLNNKGITGQWGTTPFSAQPNMQQRLNRWIEAGDLFVGRVEGDLVGVLAVSEHIPEYAVSEWERRPARACYLEAFTTNRRYQGRGVGSALIKWAEAYSLERGVGRLRLDCWGENAALCAYYEGQGYTPCGDFRVGNWRGQLFEKAVQ